MLRRLPARAVARTEPFLLGDRRAIHQVDPPASGLKPEDSAVGRLLLFFGVLSGVFTGFGSDELGDALH